nr:J domain-containing protein [uncultured Desulfobulbus sp.]
MTSPYEILEVSADADDAQIKKAYLALVRRYPPERSPVEFQRVYQAYELVKDEEARLSYRLFHCEPPTQAGLVELLLANSPKTGRPTKAAFQKRLGQDLAHFLAEFQR